MQATYTETTFTAPYCTFSESTYVLSVIKVDLDVDADSDGLISVDAPDDPIEMSAGGLVQLGNREPIILCYNTSSGRNILVLTKNSTKIDVYNSATGGTKLNFDGNDNAFANHLDLPKTLYVEGKTLSTAAKDVVLTMTFDGTTFDDKIAFTVYNADLDGVSAFTGVALPDFQEAGTGSGLLVGKTADLPKAQLIARPLTAGPAGLARELSWDPADDSKIAILRVSTGTIIPNGFVIPSDVQETFVVIRTVFFTDLTQSIPVTMKARRTGLPNVFNADEVKLVRVQIILDRIISDQFTGIECNNKTWNSPFDQNSPLLMGVRDTTDEARITVVGQTRPVALGYNSMVGIRDNASSSVYAQGVPFLDGPTRNHLTWTQGGINDLDDEVVAGIDVSGDGILDDAEVLVVFPHNIRAVSSIDYALAGNFLNMAVVLNLFSGVGADFMDFFLRGAYGSYTPSEAVQDLTTLTPSEQDHPLGQLWSSSCNAACFRQSFSVGTTVSKGVASHDVVVNAVKKILDARSAHVLTTLAASLNTHETFGAYSFGGRIDFARGGSLLNLAGNPEGQAWGRVILKNTQLTFTVRKSDKRVTLINYSGMFDDLYDFNIDKITVGAKIQAGYNTIDTQGRTFKSHVDFARTANESEFIYNF